VGGGGGEGASEVFALTPGVARPNLGGGTQVIGGALPTGRQVEAKNAKKSKKLKSCRLTK